MTLVGLEYLKHQESKRSNLANEQLGRDKIVSTEGIAALDRDSKERIASLDRTSKEGIAEKDRYSKEGIAQADRLSKEKIANADRESKERVAAGDRLSKQSIAALDRDANYTLKREEMRSKEGIASQERQMKESQFSRSFDLSSRIARVDNTVKTVSTLNDLLDSHSKRQNAAFETLGNVAKLAATLG